MAESTLTIRVEGSQGGAGGPPPVVNSPSSAPKFIDRYGNPIDPAKNPGEPFGFPPAAAPSRVPTPPAGPPTGPPNAGGVPPPKPPPTAPPAAGGAPDPNRPPVAPVVKVAQPAGGVDPATQAELNRQHQRDVEKEKADRAAVKAQSAQYGKTSSKADRWTDAVTNEEARADRAKAAQAVATAQTMDKARTAAGAAQTFAGGGGLGSKASAAMQLAGTGMLGSSAAALAGGPIGAAVMAGGIIYDQVNKLVAEPFKHARQAIEGFSQLGQKIANNDLGGIIDQATEGVAAGLEKTGIAGTVMAETLRTATAGVRAFQTVVNAFVERGRQLEGFNGSLAAAGSAQDVRRLMDDIREAQVTGPDVARLTKGQTELESLGREIMLLIKSEVIAALAEIVEPMGEIAKELRPIMRLITNNQREMGTLASFVRALPLPVLLRLLARFLKLLDSPYVTALIGKVEDEEETPLDELFAAAQSLLPPPNNGPRKDRAQAQAVGEPIWARELGIGQ